MSRTNQRDAEHVQGAPPPSGGASPWWSALTLEERGAGPEAPLRSGAPDSGGGSASERALRKYDKWRAQWPFKEDEGLLAERLKPLGLTPGALPRLIDETARDLRDRSDRTPWWVAELTERLSSADQARPAAKSSPADTEPHGFLIPAAPLLRHGLERLREGMAALAPDFPLRIDIEAVESSLLESLHRELVQIIARTAVLELNVARLEGRLTSGSPEERYEEFVGQLARPERMREFWSEYPVLARITAERVDQWVRHNLALLADLAQDWPAIRERLRVPEGTRTLTEASLGLGDRHAGGRSVSSLRFDSGFRLIYKPRPLSVDAHFQELLEWTNDNGQPTPFRVLDVVDAGDHGWVEFVEGAPCESAEELRDFYRRQGGLLALLHMLHAVDFHFENLIASGPHPVLVDLETLFHPNHWMLGTGNAAPANVAMGDSVTQTGLLPRRKYFAGDDQDAGTETSGLGGPSGQLTPYAMPYWEDYGSDEMRLDRKRQVIEDPGANRPTLSGGRVSAVDHVEDIVEGFDSTYRLLWRHRDALLAPGGRVSNFSEDRVRFIARPTATYALSLVESYHPDVLRDALDRDRLLDHLWIPRDRDPVRSALCTSERRDLEHNDVPLFHMRPSQRHVWDSAERIHPDLLDRPIMESVRERFQEMGEASLAHQLWFIRASFTTLSDDATPETSRRLHAERPATERELVSTASAIGDRLAQLALGDDDTVDWVSVNLVNQRSWTLGPAGNDLYFGQWGVALALGYLGSLTGERRHSDLARRVVDHMTQHVLGDGDHDAHDHGSVLAENIGAFHAGPAAIYVLSHLGVLWDDPKLLARAGEVARIVVPGIDTDDRHDILGGSAGLLCVLLSLYQTTGDQDVLRHAMRCGDRLIDQATPMPDGLAWHTPRFGPAPLAGFSHGASGVAHALLKLFEATGRPEYAETAERAMAYERGLFSPWLGNWPDLREAQQPEEVLAQDGPPFMIAWCHGAPGVGLARLSALSARVDEENARGELDTAVETTLRQVDLRDDSLCHGSLGNLDFLTASAVALGRTDLREQVLRFASGLLSDADEDGWKCGIPGAVETPGLMTGLSGICLGLLRVASPDRVPSVLTLAPPGPVAREVPATPRSESGTTIVVP
ncbi:type 2 lanthipeptide synthetase LanM family protein [Nocardiopsis sp. MG754419]|uniref:type 2 lanthipeptide synthetase LanM family protein n=1 Tax=Nocardiopsis sp. MG754419 TaxID=2259865 RepID=UPI001BABE90F|nr:type 2 lanthipeptide synthetase LanM family protein [Nocardiopsis sp. MG754419]